MKRNIWKLDSIKNHLDFLALLITLTTIVFVAIFYNKFFQEMDLLIEQITRIGGL